ncbi:hypothetical protein BJX70DRAFT_45398 [Aspergillus crustosus]
MTETSNTAIWRSILTHGSTFSWVLFEHNTCVILTEPNTDDPATQAIEILKKWGPVHVGTPAADFNILDLPDETGGFIVLGHHNDVLNYVSPDAVEEGTSHMAIGLIGRGNRHRDAEELKVVHVEDKRGSSLAPSN